MSTEQILTSVADRVLTVRFNRPEKKNALTQTMYTRLAEIFGAVDADKDVRAVLITGTDDCFCSGNDLQDFLSLPPAGPDAPVLRFMRALAGVGKPIVAAVNGPAVGVGTTLLFHADLAYAGETTRFHLPFVNIGICPEYASSLLLPRMIGHVQAAELVMLAEPFIAVRARRAADQRRAAGCRGLRPRPSQGGEARAAGTGRTAHDQDAAQALDRPARRRGDRLRGRTLHGDAAGCRGA
jgi:enoyl-CoA hydratase/carnithine racemase